MGRADLAAGTRPKRLAPTQGYKSSMSTVINVGGGGAGQTKCCEHYRITQKQTNKLRGLQSASELYGLIDGYLLAKFSANFCG
jgi:hypothetical protein